MNDKIKWVIQTKLKIVELLDGSNALRDAGTRDCDCDQQSQVAVGKKWAEWRLWQGCRRV